MYKSVDFVYLGYYILWPMSIIEQLEAAGEVLSFRVRATLEVLEAAVPRLEERIRELEAQLRRNSTNSSKPPSSDPPGVVRRSKKATGKKRGGQKGHPGHHRKRIAAERVDTVLVHRPHVCEHCAHSLEGTREAKPAQVHQVVELPEIRAEVTEHRMLCVRCPGCRKLTRAKLPAQVGGKHFGPRLVALGTLLNGQYRLSRRGLKDLLGKLLDVPGPSLGSTEAFTQETSAALKPVHDEAWVEVRRSASAHVDETSWKLAGMKHWLWVAVTARATLFHLGPGRGSEELLRFLGPGYGGVTVSDRWSAYQICRWRQLCWAHLVRNFEELGLRGGKAVQFSEAGMALCRQVFTLWRSLQEATLSREELRVQIEPVRTCMRHLLEQGAASGEKRVAGFCRNVLKLWPWLWTFVEEPVDPTNNAAERALRPAVLWRKGSFGNQSETGLRYAERVLTFTSTCRQLNTHPIDFLSRAIFALRSGTAIPRLVPAN